MDEVFLGLAGLLLEISLGLCPWETPRRSPARPWKTPSIPPLVLGLTQCLPLLGLQWQPGCLEQIWIAYLAALWLPPAPPGPWGPQDRLPPCPCPTRRPLQGATGCTANTATSYTWPSLWPATSSWPNKYMLERNYLGIMLCVSSGLRNSNIFHPLFILMSQSKILGQIIF